MAIIKGLSKIGASYSLILDKALMQLLNMTPETKVEIRTDGTSLIVTPLNTEEAYQKMDKGVKEAFTSSIEKNHDLYTKLAERDSIS